LFNIQDNEDAKPKRTRCHTQFKAPNEKIRSLLYECGFEGLANLQGMQIDWHLVTAMALRWRPETHTFNLPSGEATVTLQDVNMLLDLSISGRPVVGDSTIGYDYIPRLFGVDSPPKTHGLSIQLTWVEEQFARMPDDPTHEELLQQLRLYIFYLFGKIIFPDASGDRVHSMYIPLLEDVATIKSYSWGSALLASLYRGLCDVTLSKHPNSSIQGCALLLFAWARCRIPHCQRLREANPPYERPLAGWYVIF
jgi:hypothetical protein